MLLMKMLLMKVYFLARYLNKNLKLDQLRTTSAPLGSLKEKL